MTLFLLIFQIAVYTLATAGLAVAVQRIRPVSKFSKASKVPSHFLRNHVPLQGVYVGVQQSPVRLLIDHKAPIYLPLWHSSKPPLPVKIWGIDVTSGNAVAWLECMARDQKVTLNPISREKDDLVSTVLLHLRKPQSTVVETIDVGKKLIELGFAQASLPNNIPKKTMESRLAPALLAAEAQAKRLRNGIWIERLPPIPLYVIYWRKACKEGEKILIITGKQLLRLTLLATKSALTGAKNLVFKSKKPVQTT